ncbi:MAG TPA: hypothetical protein VGF38_07495, partial [Ktedonobacterales bacterium]
DPQAILDAVDVGTVPNTWKIYRAKSSYFWSNGLSLILLALLMASIVVVPVALIIGFRPELDIRIQWDNGVTYLVPLAAVFFAVFAILFGEQGCMLLAQVHSARRQVLTLTPEGVVGRMGRQLQVPISPSATVGPVQSWDGAPHGRIFSIRYDKLRSVRLYVTNSKYEKFIQLVLTLAPSERQYFWLIDNRFPDTDIIAQSIIEAHARYKALDAAAQ